VITHRAFFDTVQLSPAQLTEAPIGCPCVDCRRARDGGWEGGEGDCLLSAEWEVDYDPHAGLSATRYSESKRNCKGQDRITLRAEGMAARWGAAFVAAIEARCEHDYWHVLACDEEFRRKDIPSQYDEPPSGPREWDNAADIAAEARALVADQVEHEAKRAARRGHLLDAVTVGLG
jgi:hypothetical protein